MESITSTYYWTAQADKRRVNTLFLTSSVFQHPSLTATILSLITTQGCSFSLSIRIPSSSVTSHNFSIILVTFRIFDEKWKRISLNIYANQSDNVRNLWRKVPKNLGWKEKIACRIKQMFNFLMRKFNFLKELCRKFAQKSPLIA